MADKEHKKIIIKKVKKGGHGGAHGGSWKVAYADFVTAMMAFFLVMWLVNSLPKEKREEIAQYFQSFSLLDTGGKPGLIPATDLSQIAQPQNPPSIVEPLSETPSGPAKEKSEAEKAAEAVKEAIEAKVPDLKDQIIVKTEADRLIVEVVEDAKGKPLFALGRSDLTPDARRALAAVAPQFAKAGKGRLTVEGHTDAYSYAGERFTNWELSTERAAAARRELEKAGVAQDAVGQVAGFAATRPFVPENPFDPKNRRIRLVMETPKPQEPAQGKPAPAPPKGKENIFAKPQEPPAPPPSPIPQEKRELLDRQIERLYDETIKGKQP
ncbi:Motility protein B [Fundidesulfovibrio magnetotacticus]|uniref:Motility protein B n=1 Tax=Fundidesulfovibrio magnetotacticus TaxID=2730080 RepID=A0A6V8LU96_9BACT|nr:flagellar motor protein MotB [Fundidesulfovibrio magnetotacticus]GFK94161.1 Motility protein B [Fundidesulfovibrio magnetotacticus]